MVGIDNETYYDSIKNRDITNMHKKSFPVYIYNAILTLPSGDEKLQYAALGRFSYGTYDYGNYRPELEDYYIECKILYVDGDIYAIIGIDDSIGSYFDNNKTHDRYYMYPYYMILSEKSSIKTYVRGRYHPKGAIEDDSSSFEMRANTLDVDSKYPIKKVSKLNKNTINKVANELQNGILKKSIEEYHKGDKEKKINRILCYLFAITIR